MKKIFVFLMVIASLLLISCDDKNYDITLDASMNDLQLKVGEEKEIKYTVSLDGTASISLDNDNVSLNGNVIKGEKEGVTKVTITCNENNDITVQISIKVVKEEVKVTDILFDITSLSVGEEKEYKVTVLPDNATNKDYEIEVMGEALVIENGLLKGIKEGTSKVIVKTNELTKEFTIEVVKAEVKVTDILFDITSVSVGEEKEYKVTVLPDNATNKDYEIEVIGDALVIENGLLKGIKEGTSKVIVKTNDLTKEFTIEVVKAEVKVTDILFDITSVSVGEEKEYKVTVLPDNATNKDYEIEVIGDALVIENGLLKGIKEGTSKVIVKTNDLTKEFTIEVVKAEVKVTDILFDISSVSVGEEKEYKVTVLPDNATNKDYEIEVIGDALVIENGLLKGIKEGTSKVIVKTNDLTKEFTIEVVKEKIDLKAKLKEVVDTIGTLVMDDLPKSTNDYQLTYEFDNYVSTNGEVERYEFDNEAAGKVTISSNGSSLSQNISFTIAGYFTDAIFNKYKSAFPAKITENFHFTNTFTEYGGTKVYITKSSNEDVFSKAGKYTQPFHDEVVELTIRVNTASPKVSRYYNMELLCSGKSIDEKADYALEYINQIYPKNSVLYFDSPSFPIYNDDYDVTYKWLDSKGNDLDFNKIAQDPVLGDAQVITVKLSCRGESTTRTIDYLVWNKYYANDEEKLDDFINAMNWQDIRVFKYPCTGGYFDTNWGYVPFIDTTSSERNQKFMLDYTYGKVRTNIKKTSTEYIVVHDTAGGAPTHTAYNFAAGQQVDNRNEKNTVYKSWHFTVGNDGIYQSLPLDEVAYHAGDGSYVYGDTYFNDTYKAWSIGGGNRNGIGIESCVNSDGVVDRVNEDGTSEKVEMDHCYSLTMRILAKLVAELLIEFDLSFDRVKGHNDFSGKDCPWVIRHTGRWNEFMNLIKLEYFVKTQLKGMNITWTSLSKDLMDDTGRLYKHDGQRKVVSYKANIEYKGLVKEYNLSSSILPFEDLSNRNLQEE